MQVATFVDGLMYLELVIFTVVLFVTLNLMHEQHQLYMKHLGTYVCVHA